MLDTEYHIHDISIFYKVYYISCKYTIKLVWKMPTSLDWQFLSKHSTYLKNVESLELIISIFGFILVSVPIWSRPFHTQYSIWVTQ